MAQETGDDHPFETLPDYLRPGLGIVSIGLNPSLASVRAGFYFANPRNRFWRALNASGLIPEPLAPGAGAMERLFREYGIGATDVVKRPTRSGAELKAADYREWAPVLRQHLLRIAPCIAWFHGKQAYANYLRHAEGRKMATIDWGKQPGMIGPSHVFVTPNPSPANAAFSLQDITDAYRELALYADLTCR